ncbi:hypothetical protein ALC57_04381 [Trachymyrmex cornetzi]|uniref:Mos1 transposase HTH domain-containing protein n=1 Tax=Trachymyrmex cornetzi TaxID=471704 RepID=A0A151JCD4_9HYME|nr:hypothetical protein ALC57_04381 [Trachymyrmex cornetzi]
MEKIEYRAIIKFLRLKGNTSTQIKAELDAVYGDSAPSFATVKRWVAEFKRGRTSLGDDERSGRPTTATTTEPATKKAKTVLSAGKDDRLNFLDVTVIRDNELIEFDWYHKPTFSGRYLNCWSQHVVSQKIGTIAGLRVIHLLSEKWEKVVASEGAYFE